MGAKLFCTSQTTCGASASAPTAIVIQGAGERKYAARRRSISAAMARPASRKIDQYFPYIQAAAPRPASAAYPGLRSRYERRNQNVAAAHSGISTVLTLYLR